MEKIFCALKVAGIVLGSWLSWMYGACDTLLITLVVMVILDYITGVSAAFYLKQASSAKGFRGIVKKVVLFAVVAVAVLIDRLVFHSSGILRGAVIGFFIANEGISILENAGRMGLPVPKKLLQALVQLGGKDKGANP